MPFREDTSQLERSIPMFALISITQRLVESASATFISFLAQRAAPVLRLKCRAWCHTLSRIVPVPGQAVFGLTLRALSIGLDPQARTKRGTRPSWIRVPALAPAAASIRRLLSGRLSLARRRFLMEAVFHCGMRTTITTHLFLISQHSEDGQSPTRSNTREMSLSVALASTKTMPLLGVVNSFIYYLR